MNVQIYPSICTYRTHNLEVCKITDWGETRLLFVTTGVRWSSVSNNKDHSAWMLKKMEYIEPKKAGISLFFPTHLFRNAQSVSSTEENVFLIDV